MKNQENRLLVSSLLYHRVMVNRLAGMNPASANLNTGVSSLILSKLCHGPRFLTQGVTGLPRTVQALSGTLGMLLLDPY